MSDFAQVNLLNGNLILSISTIESTLEGKIAIINKTPPFYFRKLFSETLYFISNSIMNILLIIEQVGGLILRPNFSF